jgi:hypothetical protein
VKTRKGAKRLQVMVISDLHCTSGDADPNVGWLSTATEHDPHRHPILALTDLCDRDASIHPQLLLVAGDMTNRADPDALRYVWMELDLFAKHIGANLIATAGNHDLDSRHATGVDPRDELFALLPSFPIPSDSSHRDRYWAHNYTICTQPGYRIVVLNSCGYHGYALDGAEEYEHGRVSRRTAERLRIDLDMLREPPPVNIVLVHHHLVQLPYVDLADKSQMLEAESLMSVLSDTGPWLVVHGHKHRARLLHAPGGGGAPLIFSAGSFSAFPSRELTAEGGRNQAYLLEFPTPAELDTAGLAIGARFRAWDWTLNDGWQPAVPRSGLPGKGGFGWREVPRVIADLIVRAVANAPLRQLSFADLCADITKLPFVMPNDLEQIARDLERREPGYVVRRESDGSWASVAAATPMAEP